MSILVSGLGVMLLAYVVGRIVGGIALRGVNEQIERHKQLNPFPNEDGPPADDPLQDAARATTV